MAEPLALYVHIPFCTAICNYCDFNTYAGHEHVIPAYSQALVQEAQLWRSATKGRRMATVFFGGGTPSLMPLEEMELVMGGLREAFEIAADAEISLEANPGSLDETYLRGLRDLGFTRLSLGVQSFHDDELKSLDRLHSADDARAAVRAARKAGFQNLSLDLMFGLPEQPLARWQQNVEEALKLEPDHLSLYALTVEEGTPLARDVARQKKPAPDMDNQADHYEWAEARLERSGFEHYEISSWARPGFRCAHNLTYWHCREYLGLGAGAHSYLDGTRFAAADTPGKYLSLVGEAWQEAERGDGKTQMRQVVSGEQITPELALADMLTLGLWLTDGIVLDDVRERTGIDAMERYGARLAEPMEAGLLENVDGRLRLTPRGRLLGNEVFALFLPD